MLRRRAAFALALAAAVTGVAVASAAPVAAHKKRCKVTTKVVHGKKKRTRVCRAIPPPTDRPAPAPALGTQARPVPIGQAVKIDPNWRLQVLGADPNRTQEIVDLQRGDPDNPPAPLEPGMQYLLGRVKLTRIGASPGTFSPYSLDLAVRNGARYDAGCGIYPDPLDASDLASGQSATGNACWKLASTDVGKVSIRYTNPFSGRKTYFALGL